ncbi:non-specific serine,threonine protein kinase, partial [Sarracenia purpurea var. burkii]
MGFQAWPHANLQVIPIPSSRASVIQDIFNLAAQNALVEQLLDVIGKELDQNNTCSTNLPWSDATKDDKFGSLTSSQCGLVELTALVFYWLQQQVGAEGWWVMQQQVGGCCSSRLV